MATSGSDVAHLTDHVLGVIYGNCCGDAIGLLTEFMPKEEAMECYDDIKHLEYTDKVKDMHRARWKVGDWTDDSDQMILIIDSINEQEQVNAGDFLHRLQVWRCHGYAELGDHVGMGIGTTTAKVLDINRKCPELIQTDPHQGARQVWEDSGSQVAPNGGIMRTSVLGVYMYQEIENVIENTKQICQCSHYDPRCVASCIAVTTSIALMLQRQHCHVDSKARYKIHEIIKCSYKYAKQQLNNKKQRKELKSQMFCTNLKSLHLGEPSCIGYTYRALGAGFWALKQDDFRTAIQKITLEGGDADSNASVAGALLGCKLGYTAIPDTWKNELLHKKWLDEKLNRFFKLVGIPDP